MHYTELPPNQWRKSTHSQSGGACIEVADAVPGALPVRDSKDPEGPALTFTPNSFTAFIQSVKNGSLATP
jgi:hypothetical protein